MSAGEADHPAARLDDVVHQRVRLGILTVLDEARRADFAYLRDELGLTDGNLSRHLRVLDQAGYVAIEKAFEGNRPRTWVSATRQGKAPWPPRWARCASCSTASTDAGRTRDRWTDNRTDRSHG
jgi:DNA-binding HxlR family transcriptional regulator